MGVIIFAPSLFRSRELKRFAILAEGIFERSVDQPGHDGLPLPDLLPGAPARQPRQCRLQEPPRKLQAIQDTFTRHMGYFTVD